MTGSSLYKVVETSIVTDEELERILNTHTREGWRFDSFHFVTRDSSRRPAMAFVLFTRAGGTEATDAESTGQKEETA